MPVYTEESWLHENHTRRTRVKSRWVPGQFVLPAMRPAPMPTTRRAKKRTRKPAAKRRYDSTLRRQQTAETRERIVAGGAKLVRGLPAWDWSGLTFHAVGTRARVSERTVYRHFSTERELRAAVLQRLFEESGIELDGLELRDFRKVAARLFAYLSSFAVAPKRLADPAFAAMDRHRREALLGAVARATPRWLEPERRMAAAMLDMLWTPSIYERVLGAWRLDADRAIGAITWTIGLIEDAIASGRRPEASPSRARSRSARAARGSNRPPSRESD